VHSIRVSAVHSGLVVRTDGLCSQLRLPVLVSLPHHVLEPCGEGCED